MFICFARVVSPCYANPHSPLDDHDRAACGRSLKQARRVGRLHIKYVVLSLRGALGSAERYLGTTE
jgi:hypothetical protein